MSDTQLTPEAIAELKASLETGHTSHLMINRDCVRALIAAAEREGKMRMALLQLSGVNLHDGNCASWDVANRQIEAIALAALAGSGNK